MERENPLENVRRNIREMYRERDRGDAPNRAQMGICVIFRQTI